MIDKFTELRLSKKNKERLGTINKIIEEYNNQGYKLTLRQLYYQLVSRDIIPNQKSEYAKLSSLLVQGRMAGIVDWDAIEDRLRVPYLIYNVRGITHAIEDTIDQYRLDRMKDQDIYIELWVEKDALSGVLKRITNHYHIRLMVNRGYSSCTAMHDAYERINEEIDDGKSAVILYLGDHDPSGLDMIRDIRKRLNTFGISDDDLEVKQIGLTMEQIEKFNPPPNPAKITDPRAKDYIAVHGNTSWEVDALNPDTLHKLVKDNVEDLIDVDAFDDVVNQEESDKKILQRLSRDYESLSEGD